MKKLCLSNSLSLLAITLLAINGLLNINPTKAATPSSVIINEFSSQSSNDWVELLNTTDSPIDLTGWKIQDLTFSGSTPTGVATTTIGNLTIPAYGIVVIDVGNHLNQNGDSITLFDNSTPLIAINNATYGTVTGQPATVGLETPPATGESAQLINSNWSITSTPNKGWFNDAGNSGVAPLLSTIDSALTSAGIDSNIGELTNPSATPTTETAVSTTTALYFEKSGKGKIVFTTSLNLSDQATVAILQDLGQKMELADSHIKFDSATATAMKTTGAKIYMYNLIGFNAMPNLIVKNDIGTTIPSSDTDNYPTIVKSWDNTTKILSFTTNHFTQFDADNTAPTVIKLGDNSNDVTIAANATTTLAFSEPLNTASKTNVEKALTAGADKTITYSWNSDNSILTITGNTTDLTTFNNDVYAEVADIVGKGSTLLLIDSNLSNTQTSPTTAGSGRGEVTVSTTTPEVVITNPTQAVDITINSDATNPTIDVSSFITDGTGTLPEIKITSANANNATVAIPSATVVTSTDNSWNGVISAPTTTTVDLPTTSGQTKTLGTAIEIGFTGAKLSFDKAVRILLTNQAGKKVGYVRTGINFTEITDTCAADDQTTGNALVADGDCKIDVGSDLIIWTKHFTSFATFTQTTNSSNSSGPSYGGGSSNSPIITIPAPSVEVPVVTKIDAGQVLGASTGVYPNGTLLKAPGSPAVWYISGHKKHLIPLATVLASRFNRDDIVKLPSGLQLDSYEQGTDVRFSTNTLVKEFGRPTTYRVSTTGGLQPIISLDIFLQRFYRTSDVIEVPTGFLDNYPREATITDTTIYDGELVAVPQKGIMTPVYYIENGQAREISNRDILNSHGFKLKQVRAITPADLKSFVLAEPMSYPDGTLIKGNKPAVYIISDGKKRAFTSQVDFNALFYSNKRIRKVSDEFLEQIVTGVPISLNTSNTN